MKKIFVLIGNKQLKGDQFKRTLSDIQSYDENLAKELKSRVISFKEIKDRFPLIHSLKNGLVPDCNSSEVNYIIEQEIDHLVKKQELVIVDKEHRRQSALTEYKKYINQGYQLIALNYADPEDPETPKYHSKLKIPGYFKTYDMFSTEGTEEFLTNILGKNKTSSKKIAVIGELRGFLDSGDKILERVYKENPDEIIFLGNLFNRDGVNSGEQLSRLQQFKSTVKANGILVYFIENTTEKNLGRYTEFCKAVYKRLQNSEVVPDWLIQPSFKELINAFGTKNSKDIPLELLNSLQEKYPNFSKPDTLILLDILMNSPVGMNSLGSINKFNTLSYYSSKLLNGSNLICSPALLNSHPNVCTPTKSLLYGNTKPYLIVEHSILFQEDVNINIWNSLDTSRSLVQPSRFFTNLEYNPNDYSLKAVILNVTDSSFELNPIEVQLTEKEREREHKKISQSSKDFIKNPEQETSDIMQSFLSHPDIIIKAQKNNIVSINYSDQAFQKGNWSGTLIKARGLFLDTTDSKNKVLMRSYNKFFNLGDINGYSKENFQDFEYPVKGYKKADGHLGLVAVDTRGTPELITGSKGSLDSQDQILFNQMLKKYWNQSATDLLQQHNCTAVFETIPNKNAHISGDDIGLVLLDVVKNQLDFELVPEVYQELIKLTDVPQKELLFEANSPLELLNQITVNKKSNRFDENGTEGMVIVSKDQKMFKVKTDWYNIWKKTNRNYNSFLTKRNQIGQRTLTISDSQYIFNMVAGSKDLSLFTDWAFKLANEYVFEDTSKKLLPDELRKEILKRIKGV